MKSVEIEWMMDSMVIGIITIFESLLKHPMQGWTSIFYISKKEKWKEPWHNTKESTYKHSVNGKKKLSKLKTVRKFKIMKHCDTLTEDFSQEKCLDQVELCVWSIWEAVADRRIMIQLEEETWRRWDNILEICISESLKELKSTKYSIVKKSQEYTSRWLKDGYLLLFSNGKCDPQLNSAPLWVLSRILILTPCSRLQKETVFLQLSG